MNQRRSIRYALPFDDKGSVSMVPVLAKQAIIIKCLAHSGIILSNYECAYAMGLLAHLADITLSPEMIRFKEVAEESEETEEYGENKEEAAQDGESEAYEMLASEILEYVMSASQAYEPQSEEEKQLVSMLQNYKPDEIMDEQVRLLFKMGYEETNLWER